MRQTSGKSFVNWTITLWYRLN